MTSKTVLLVLMATSLLAFMRGNRDAGESEPTGGREGTDASREQDEEREETGGGGDHHGPSSPTVSRRTSPIAQDLRSDPAST